MTKKDNNGNYAKEDGPDHRLQRQRHRLGYGQGVSRAGLLCLCNATRSRQCEGLIDLSDIEVLELDVTAPEVKSEKSTTKINDRGKTDYLTRSGAYRAFNDRLNNTRDIRPEFDPYG